MNSCSEKLTCTIDIGTTSLKVGMFSASKVLLSFKKYVYDKSGILWDDLSFFTDFQAELAQIEVISISAQSPSIVPVFTDRSHGTPVFYYEKEKHITIDGDLSVFLPKVAYHKTHYPDEYERACAYANLGDYLVYKLTGVLITSLPHPHYASAVWQSESIKRYDLDETKFPPVVIWPQQVGVTRSDLPCPAGIKVLASNYDFLAATYGLDGLNPHIATDRGGSSLGLNFFFEEKDLACVHNDKPFPELAWHIYPQIKEKSFNAGLVFPDFDNFISLIKRELDPQDTQDFEDLLKAILGPLLTKKPLSTHSFTPCLSFMQMWENSAYTTALERAQDVFMQYGSLISMALSGWPVAKIQEVRASGGPNESKIFVEFKEKMTQLPWQTTSTPYAELIGNFYATKLADKSQ